MRADDMWAWVHLATRIPKTLHRRLKIHCVGTGTSVMGFVVAAIQEKLAREAGARTGARRGKRATSK